MKTRMITQKIINLRRAIIIDIAILAVFFICDAFGIFDIPRLKMQDIFVKLNYKLSPPPKSLDKIAIIAIDDVLGRKWPWDRSVFADLIYKLNRMGPAIVGISLGFIGESQISPESDFFLAEAIRDAGNVVLVSYFDEYGKYVTPLEIISEFSLGVGFTNKPVDKDGIIREAKLFEKQTLTNEIVDYSFDLKLASLFLGHGESDFRIPVNRNGVIPINFSVKLSDINVIPFSSLINEEAPKEAVHNKMVLVGTNAEMFHDIFDTPLGRMSSVGIVANTVLMFLDKDFIYQIPKLPNILLLVAVVLLASVGISRARKIRGILLLGGIIAGFIGVSIVLVFNNVYWDFFSIPAVLLTLYMTSGITHYITLFIQSLKVRRLATTDTLTELPTRRYLIFKLESELKSTSEKEKMSVVLFKLENYESIITEAGMENANLVVRDIGKMISNLSRKTRGMDFIARYGETEFCSVLHRTPLEGGLAYAERIIKTINKRITSVSTAVIRAGIADRKDIPYQSSKIFVRCAETALSRAQKEGVSNICVFNPELDNITTEDYMEGKEISESDLTYVADELEAKNKELAILLNKIRVLRQDVIASERLSVTGKVAAIIHHDLNKPIVNLRKGLKILIEDLLNEADPKKLSLAREFVGAAIKETERLESLTWQLKDLYHPAEKEVLEISINTLIDEMLNLSFAQITKANIRLIKDMMPGLPSVIANAGDLKQVFLNLIMNAVESMPEGGQLEVRTQLSKNMIELDIKDNGCGIAPENMDKIFKAFFTTKAKEKGSGLGLYASMEIIRKYGGTIKVESEINKGSTFKVFLPFNPAK